MWFQFIMNGFYMFSEIPTQSCWVITLITREAFNTLMNCSHMYLKNTILGCCIGTLFTLEWSQFLMNWINMPFKASFFITSIRAPLTFKHFFFRHCLQNRPALKTKQHMDHMMWFSKMQTFSCFFLKVNSSLNDLKFAAKLREIFVKGLHDSKWQERYKQQICVTSLPIITSKQCHQNRKLTQQHRTPTSRLKEDENALLEKCNRCCCVVFNPIYIFLASCYIEGECRNAKTVLSDWDCLIQ